MINLGYCDNGLKCYKSFSVSPCNIKSLFECIRYISGPGVSKH